MEVCRMRDTPVIVFVNKMDRDGKDPFDLLDELEEKLKINVRPLSWPINMGADFKGVYNLVNKTLNLYAANKTSISDEFVPIADLRDKNLDQNVGMQDAKQLREDAELIEGVYEEFDNNQYLEGNLAPVFFGSALNSFGIQELLETFIKIAPIPQYRITEERKVEPTENRLSGFIFKIHANLDPNHRDRIAFFRICSGTFERNKFYLHNRLDKKIRFSNPYTFLAQDKKVAEEAFPGDVVGLYDTGNFKIGDSLSEGETLTFKGIPRFSPEMFQELINLDPMKSKQLEKGIEQLTDEGVAQLFRLEPGNRKIIGTVGELQFEVIQYRLEHEYGAKCRFERKSYHKACWMTGDESKIAEFIKFKSNVATDKDGVPVFLAETRFTLQMAIQNNPDITFHTTNEINTKLSS